MSEMSSDRDTEVQELLDKQAIQDVMVQYCRGLDRMDGALISSVYHPDAYDDHGGRTFSGADVGQSIVDWLKELNVKIGIHHITNQTILVNGDIAGCESYYTGFMLESHDGDQRTMQMMGRYLDRLERRNGEWKISRRKVVAEMFRYLPSGDDPSAAHWHLEARHDPDPSYAVLGGR
jgi:ketosteroid isomerase-like protein